MKYTKKPVNVHATYEPYEEKKEMKKLFKASLFFIVSVLFSIPAFATEHLITVKENRGYYTITTSDFADAVGFENYKCHVDFGSWVLKSTAKKIQINGENYYRCAYQGTLQRGITYDVYFTFENRPYRLTSRSANFKIRVD